MSDPFAQIMRRRYRDWDSFTVADLGRLTTGELGTMNLIIASRDPELGDIIPRSFFERYGDGAYAQFARGIARESRERGDTQILARTVLEGGYSGGWDMRYGSAPYRYEDGRTVQSTAPEMLGAHIGYDAVQNRDNTTYVASIPRDAVRALRRDNPQYVTEEQAEGGIGRGIELRDEGAYLGGYYAYGSPSDPVPSRRGVGSNIVQVTPNYDREAGRQAFPAAAREVHNPNRPDQPVGYGYVLGYAQAEEDSRYGYSNADDYEYGQQPPPRTPGGGNAGASHGGGRSATPPPPPPR